MFPYTQIIDFELKRNNVTVKEWSKNTSGKAFISQKEVIIPKPTDIISFCVGLHEIGHIVLGLKGKLHEYEYEAEQFVFKTAKKHGVDASPYLHRARTYVIMCIAKDYAAGFPLFSLRPEIKGFCEIDFSKWNGKNVTVTGWGTKFFNINISTPKK